MGRNMRSGARRGEWGVGGRKRRRGRRERELVSSFHPDRFRFPLFVLELTRIGKSLEILPISPEREFWNELDGWKGEEGEDEKGSSSPLHPSYSLPFLQPRSSSRLLSPSKVSS